MKNLAAVPAFAIALSVLSAPVAVMPLHAQEAAATVEQGWLEWGMSLFGDSVMQEVAPAIGDIRALAEQFGPTVGPAVEKLLALVDDMTNYELPQMQENGDILIRRKPDAPAAVPPAAGDSI